MDHLDMAGRARAPPGRVAEADAGPKRHKNKIKEGDARTTAGQDVPGDGMRPVFF